jgi:hypothetical protein
LLQWLQTGYHLLAAFSVYAVQIHVWRQDVEIARSDKVRRATGAGTSFVFPSGKRPPALLGLNG